MGCDGALAIAALGLLREGRVIDLRKPFIWQNEAKKVNLVGAWRWRGGDLEADVALDAENGDHDSRRLPRCGALAMMWTVRS